MARNVGRASRRILGIAGCALVLSCGGGGGGSSGGGEVLWVLVPENPAYVAYREAVEAGLVVAEQSPDPHRAEDFAIAGGRLAGPLAPPSVGGFCAFPAALDLRAEGRATPVWGSDCPCGMCWTSAVLACVESAMAPGDVRDLSENHLQLGGWDGATCFQGGHAGHAVPYFAAWRGPVDHSDFHACDMWPLLPIPLPARAHVQNAYFLPRRQGPLDLCWIKWFLMNVGGVYAATSYGWGQDFVQNTQYFPLPGWEIHAVTILGWDDAFDRNRFYCPHPDVPPAERIPPGDGAFLVKDNQAAKWDQGHFWVSYYDRSFAMDPVAFAAEPVGNYLRNYQHDPYGMLDYMLLAPVGAGALAAWQGNVFTAVSDEYLAAVGLFEFESAAADYRVEVHLDPVGGPANPAGPAVAFDVSLLMKGYFTAKLPSPLLLRKGQRFGVVLRGRDRDGGWPTALALERPNGPLPLVQAAPGQSYVSTNGTTWQDLTTVSYWVDQSAGIQGTLSQTNLRIKAFTTPVLTAKASLSPGDLSVSWEIHNAGAEAGSARPEARGRVQVGTGYEPVGDPFSATRYVDEMGDVHVTDDGWVPVPPGGRVTALSEPYAAETYEQIAWHLQVVDGLVVHEGIVEYLNDLVSEPLHVVSSDPADGANVNVPFVPVLTLTFDAPLKVGTGLQGISVWSASDSRSVYASVAGNVLQIVPSKPLDAKGLGGTTWHLHVPKDAVLSATLGNPLVNAFDISFHVTGVN